MSDISSSKALTYQTLVFFAFQHVRGQKEEQWLDVLVQIPPSRVHRGLVETVACKGQLQLHYVRRSNMAGGNNTDYLLDMQAAVHFG